MMLFEQYLILHDALAGETPDKQAQEVTLNDIARVLFCTVRNAKLVLRKLEEQGWINWNPGRGRGHRSRLSFLANRTILLHASAQQMADKGDYQAAFALLRDYGDGIINEDSFVGWMNGHFGFYKEVQEGGNKSEDSLRLPIYRAVDTLDPAECVYSFSAHMIQQIFDRLVSYDRAADRFTPAIAHHWESSGDGLEWVFYLRKGIFFHDGTELTAEDVKFTIERLQHGKRNRWIVRELQQVEAVTPRIVKFRLKKPNRIFIRYLCAISMSILPKHLVLRHGDSYWRKPVGTGPFLIKDWTRDHLIIEAHSHYYQGRPHLDRVHIVIMPEDAAHCEVSWQQLLQYPDGSSTNSEVDNIRTVQSANANRTSIMKWNMNKAGPHQWIQFRMAFDLILDREGMIKEWELPGLSPAHGYFLNDQAYDEQARFDPEQAQRLLTEAGYDGAPIVMGCTAFHMKDAEWIQKQCASIGIPIILREEKMEQILRLDVMREMDCILYALVLPGEEVCLIEHYEQEGSFGKELTERELHDWIITCIDDTLASTTGMERLDILANIEKKLLQEVEIHFLTHSKSYVYSHTSYRGVMLNDLGWLDFRQIWRD
ncbi:SgrR family transcriptional regulator [Paenibacillus sp. JCM 10914]|uniref:ABC transporter substrate-binding protein n=1 Tax=Paenibacillus sp. JCM 10914 TaxID=1236974 RepID=UPI0003CC93BA|nr:ABC transporter substrate-binding protein [Paenibacillus sp. JCM 10914]GAE08373.1 SgrR, sugar-phosphate stress, transcriptional activator of SgrS small RNA [Paenibacillus sp. JCM 10914]